MVKVTKDGKVRELATEVQLSVFLRSGWKVKEDAPVAPFMNPPEVSDEPEEVKEPVAAPKRRGRRAK